MLLDTSIYFHSLYNTTVADGRRQRKRASTSSDSAYVFEMGVLQQELGVVCFFGDCRWLL
jgi:hypothetical protein